MTIHHLKIGEGEGGVEEGNEKIGFKKKKKTPFCITRSMAEDYSREQLLFSSLVETLFYFFVLLVSVIYISSNGQTSEYYLNAALGQIFLDRQFDTSKRSREEQLTFKSINTVADFWDYTFVLFQGLYDNDTDLIRTVSSENIILGVPRMRQLRVTNDSCTIHKYFRKTFTRCYDAFSARAEDKSTFGTGNGTAWTYSSPAKTQSTDFTGVVSRYHGGGYYVDFALDVNTTMDMFVALEAQFWITRNTRVIFIDFSLYNVDTNLFAICKLIFELPPTGGVLADYKFTVIKLLKDETFWEKILSVCEALFYICILLYFCLTLREIIYFKLRFFIQFWTYIDCVITALAVTTFVLKFLQSKMLKPTLNKIKKHPAAYGNLEYLGDISQLHDDLLSVALFLIIIRLFKYLSINKTMGQLNDTIKKCAMDVLGFSIMFFIIFFAYAELGFLLFGSKVAEFRSFAVSMFTLLRTILGDFNYPDIEHANGLMAPIYFLSYIFLVFFVLLNMFLAIINDTYADVKTEISIAPTELQMTQYIKRIGKRILRKCGIKVRDDDEVKSKYLVKPEYIKSTLKKIGCDSQDIEQFFERFGLDLKSKKEIDLQKLSDQIPGGPAIQMETSTASDFVKLSEFAEQKRQLKTIEAVILSIGKAVDGLLKKIEELDAKPPAPKK